MAMPYNGSSWPRPPALCETRHAYGCQPNKGGSTVKQFHVVARTSDLSPGEIMLVEVEGQRILLSNLDGEFYAIGELCTHADGFLSDGEVEGEQVECPRHGSFFNLK